MNVVRYRVRALTEDGRVVFKDSYKRKSVAEAVANRLEDKWHTVRIRKAVTQDKFQIEGNQEWGIRPHDPYVYAHGPLHTIFIHTSVTEQLDARAGVHAEREQMRSVDNIAWGRGFNGFSYSYGVFPSGRAYEGRGWLVAEAATAPYNTSSDSICCIGNTDVFKPTEAQVESIIAVIKRGQKRGAYGRSLNIRGHRDVAPKACPGAQFTDASLNYIQRKVNN